MKERRNTNKKTLNSFRYFLFFFFVPLLHTSVSSIILHHQRHRHQIRCYSKNIQHTQPKRRNQIFSKERNRRWWMNEYMLTYHTHTHIRFGWKWEERKKTIFTSLVSMLHESVHDLVSESYYSTCVYTIRTQIHSSLKTYLISDDGAMQFFDSTVVFIVFPWLCRIFFLFYSAISLLSLLLLLYIVVWVWVWVFFFFFISNRCRFLYWTCNKCMTHYWASCCYCTCFL